MTWQPIETDWEWFSFRDDGWPKWIRIKCARDHGCNGPSKCVVPIDPQTDGRGHAWKWNGSLDKPTLSPSINCGDCGYHFFVTDGRLDPAPAYNRSELSEYGEDDARRDAASNRTLPPPPEKSE